jgi:hypothetical protein
MHLKKGSRRFVIVLKDRVIKIPRFTSWLPFVMGVVENLQERYWWCSDGYVSPPSEWYDANRSTRNLAQIYWADRFGLCVIMERVQTLDHLETRGEVCMDPEFLRCEAILRKEYSGMSFLSDLRPSNIGLRADGRVVFVDYGFFPCTPQWCLGRKVIRKPSHAASG